MSAQMFAERLDGLSRALQAAVRLANDTDATDDVLLIVGALVDTMEVTAFGLAASLVPGAPQEVEP
jgi:hypothetical protein